jgi:hypothetical protein
MEMDHRSLYERTWTRWSFVFYPPKSGKGPERQKSERQKFSLQIRLSTFWYLIWRQKRSEPQKSNFSDFRRSFWRSDFWHSDLLTFKVLIIPKKLSTFWPFDVLIFDVPIPSPKRRPKSYKYLIIWNKCDWIHFPSTPETVLWEK